ncbi:alpha/beta hydrolase [Chloroflexia bacterium SDU3-3]|nr:alpha/beta hydrolase [Chloroflexia bacterium SDU3-3]
MSNQGNPMCAFAQINGLELYYEVHGSGSPLVLIHGGGSTIESTFGYLLPTFARSHRVIAVELQAHGRTKDIDRPLSFEQDADDVAALLQHLQIDQADFLGFSNGGTTCLQLGIRHPTLVRKLVLASAIFRRSGMPPNFFDGFDQATIAMLPEPLKQAYLKVNPDPAGLQAMFERDTARMRSFQDIRDEDIRSITAATLVINGDAEMVLASHALELAQTLPQARLAILPSGHGDYLGELMSAEHASQLPALVATMIEEFLAA